MSKAHCSKCGELKTVCCDSGFTVNEDGSYHHISPFCVDCCPNTLTESRRGQIRQFIQDQEQRGL